MLHWPAIIERIDMINALFHNTLEYMQLMKCKKMLLYVFHTILEFSSEYIEFKGEEF